MSDLPRAWHKIEHLMGTLRHAQVLFLQPVLHLHETSVMTLSLRAGWSVRIGTSLSSKRKHLKINAVDSSSRKGMWALIHMKAYESALKMWNLALFDVGGISSGLLQVRKVLMRTVLWDEAALSLYKRHMKVKALVGMGVLDGCKWVGMGIEWVLELIWMA